MHLLTQLLAFPPPNPMQLPIATNDSQMNNENNENNEIALCLANASPTTSQLIDTSTPAIRVLHLIETSYCETECCFQLIRTTKTKTNIDRNTINTIEILRGPRTHMTDTQNETHF